MIELGIRGRQETTVTTANVATNVGSGNVKSIIIYGYELILCSDKNVMYSTNKVGASWFRRI